MDMPRGFEGHRAELAATAAGEEGRCIENCLACHGICSSAALTRCLELGGRHADPGQLRLLLACAEICRTAAFFVGSHAPSRAGVCAVCAEICNRCSAACERLGQLADCVQACRRSAESCQRLAAVG